MKVLADENIDRAVVNVLRQAGHDVLWMVENGAGTSDLDILQIARREQRIILTFDHDFGELVFHSRQNAPGVVLFRFDSQPPEKLLECFKMVWPKLESKIAGHFIVATTTKIRIRPMPL